MRRPTATLRRRLLSSPLITCEESLCRAPAGGCGADFAHDGYLTLARTGAYAFHTAERMDLVDPGSALLYRGDEPYRISHPVPRAAGDKETMIRPDPDLLGQLLAPSAPAVRAAPLRARIQLAHRQALRALATAADADRLGGEEILIDLVRAVVHDLGLAAPPPRSTAGARRAVQRVRARLAADPGGHAGLADLAATASTSPYHLCRSFKRETGMTLRGYRVRLRLALALERLAEGQENLAALAAELGFAHHSHLTAAFRERFGVPPAILRRQLSARRLRESSKFLTAPPSART